MSRDRFRSRGGVRVRGDAAPANPSELIKQAFEKTKTAATLDEFDEVIAICEQLKTAPLSAPLTTAQADYVKKLASWLLNRCGEIRSDLAAKTGEEGRGEEASELDGLALADFEMAIELDTSRSKPFHNRGVSLVLAGNYNEALADFKKAIAISPGYANTWFNLGEVHYELGQWSEAVRDYSEAIRLAPEDAEGLYQPRQYLLFSRRRGARPGPRPPAFLRRDHRLQSSRPSARRQRPGSRQSRRRVSVLRKWEWASNDYERAIKLDDTLARADAGLAWLMATCPDAEYRNVDEALAHAQRAIDLGAPEETYLFEDALAAAQASAGRYDEAQATLAKAIEAAPEKEKAGLSERLTLYQNGQPYRQ